MRHTTNTTGTEDRRKRRFLLPILLGLIAFGAVLASAASLGGINNSDLGADADVVASCDTDGVDVDFVTSYDAVSGEYVVDSVDVSGIAAACNGQDISVTVSDGTGAALSSGSAVVGGASQRVALAPSASAESVEGIAIVIAG